MPPSWMLQPTAPLAAIALKATVLLLVAALVVRFLGRSSSAARHGVWTLAILALLALPLAQALLPRIEAPFLRAAPALRKAPVRPLEPDRASPGPPVGLPGREPQSASPAPPSTRADRSSGDPWSWSRIATMAWAIGALSVLLFFSIGKRAIARSARHARPVEDTRWLALVSLIGARLGLRRPVRLLRGQPGQAPMTWGTWRPVILIPSDADGWSEERRRAFLTHEIGHVCRLDCAFQDLANLACSLYWFHPFVWFAAHRMRVERERACDDLVLEQDGGAEPYARDLVELVRESRWHHPSLAVSTASMASPSRLEERLRAILDGSIDRRRPSVRVCLTACVLAAGLALPLAALAPRASAVDRSDTANPSLDGDWQRVMRENQGKSFWILYAIPFGGGHDGRETLFSDSEEGHFDEIGRRGPSLAERHGFEPDDAVILFRVGKRSSSGLAFDRIAIRSARLSQDTNGLAVVSLGRRTLGESFAWLRDRLRNAPEDERTPVLVTAVSLHQVPEAPKLLESILEGPRGGRTRTQAAEGLTRHPSQQALDALVRHARRDGSVEVRRESAEAVGDLPYAPATEALIQLVSDIDEESVRLEAVEALGMRPPDRVIPILVGIANDDSSEQVECEAVETLGDLPDHAGLDALRRIVKAHPSERVRKEAFETLNEMSARATRDAEESEAGGKD